MNYLLRQLGRIQHTLTTLRGQMQQFDTKLSREIEDRKARIRILEDEVEQLTNIKITTEKFITAVGVVENEEIERN